MADFAICKYCCHILHCKLLQLWESVFIAFESISQSAEVCNC